MEALESTESQGKERKEAEIRQKEGVRRKEKEEGVCGRNEGCQAAVGSGQ